MNHYLYLVEKYWLVKEILIFYLPSLIFGETSYCFNAWGSGGGIGGGLFIGGGGGGAGGGLFVGGGGGKSYWKFDRSKTKKKIWI